MASSSRPPSSDQLATLLASDPAREAVDALRGYDWQRWLTIEMWLGLGGEEALWIEWGEDFTVATEGKARAIQARDLSAKITLGQAKILSLISEALLRGPRVRTIIWTRAQPGFEKGKPFSEPGIDHWRKVVAGEVPGNKLKDFLMKSECVSTAAATCITQTPDNGLPSLFAKLDWVTGEESITGLRERVLPLAEERLTNLGIPNASVLRDAATACLFDAIAEVSVREDRAQRRVTRIDLDRLLLHQNLTWLAAFAPMVQAAPARQTQVTFSSVEKHIAAVPGRTARLVTESLGQLGLSLAQPASGASPTAPKAIQALQPELTKARQQDLELKYKRAVQRSLFPQREKVDESFPLAIELLEGGFAEVSSALRRKILLRATRSTALRGDIADAERLLSAAHLLEGFDSELPAAARLAMAKGDPDGAIRLLRDEHDADSRSTLLSILAQHQGDDVAVAWLASNNLTAADLTANGVLTLCQIHLRKNDFEGLARAHAHITDQQCVEDPYLFFLRGTVRFASIFAKPYRQTALLGIPLDRFAHPVLPDSELSTHLDATIDDLQRVQPIALELGLREASRIAEAYVRWCGLLHPGRKQAALARLRKDMAELKKSALPHVQFALAFDPEFDPTPLSSLLEKREALGGLDDDELRAALVLRLHGDDPHAVADFIGKHRSRLETSVSPVAIRSIEIQALAKAKEATSAKLLLDEHKDLFPSELTALLEAEIAKAEGSDPVAEYKRVYEETKSVEALRALVSALAAKNDRLAIARYGEELYGLTGDPSYIAMAARALAHLGDDENFLRVIQDHPSIEQLDPFLARHHAWVLFRLGRLKQAKQFAEHLRGSGPEVRDLDLEIAIAVESGEWENLGATLTAYLDVAVDPSGRALIRAAHLAQASGQGPTMALMEAALQKSPDDPNVLLGAYMLLVEEGLEEEKPAAAAWFNRALDLSGPDGPIRRFEIKEILSWQTEWNERTRKINEAIIRGDMPLLVAAPGLRTTLADIVLRNFARNSTLADPRRRTAIPLFNGRRAPAKPVGVQRIALDLSALMTMGWLGFLPKVIASYPEVLIPAGALCELFEGRRRIRELQKSRLIKAKQLRDAIAQHRLKVKSPAGIRDNLDKDVGTELATLIRAAEADDGIVVRPAPVHRAGAMDEDADVSAHETRLADMHSLLAVLVDQGAVDQTTEETARRYFGVQDKGWPTPAVPAIDRALFLDGLSVVYLQSVGLLEAVLDTFPSVHIDASTEEEASSLFEHEQQTNEVLRIIDEIRDAVRKGAEVGKVVFGPRTSCAEDEEGRPESSSIHLLADLAGAEVVVFDDRTLNKEPFAVDHKNHRARVVTSLNVIEYLLSRGVVREGERRAFHHRLRLAGVVLMPVDAEEITAAALRNRQNESPEFRAIRESIGLARIANVPRFPAEIDWFVSMSMAVNAAIIAVWRREPDLARATMLADAILDLRPSPEDWIVGWGDHPPADWIEAVTRAMTARLAFPVEIETKNIVNAYNEWLERKVLAPMRSTSPLRYQAIVNQLRSFVASDSGEDDGEVPSDARCIKVQFALSKLPLPLRSNVLADGSIAKCFGLRMKHSVNLSADIVLHRDELFAAFQRAADGAPLPPLHNELGGPVEASISIDADGAGTVTIGAQRWRFEHAVLLSSARDCRISALDKCLAQHTLTRRDRDYLREVIGRLEFSNNDYLTVVSMLTSSPESFADRFREVLETTRIGKTDLLPEDVRHWKHLTVPVERSSSLSEFIDNELADEWRARLSADPKQAFRSIALTFASPALVPRSLFEGVDTGTMIELLEIAGGFDDPFGLTGAFQICADRLGQGMQFVALGEHLLDRLFTDMDRLKTACQIFAAAFVISTARLAEHEVLRGYPPFWRRLAAASHASLVVRSCGEVKQDGLFAWAMNVSGGPYVLSVLNDFSVEPKWRPEWIYDYFLVADVYGRVSTTMHLLPENRVPDSWRARVDAAKVWIEKHHLQVPAHFPAVLEGARKTLNPSLAELRPLAGLYRKLANEPRSDQFLMLSAPTFIFGFPPEAYADALKVVLDLRRQPESLDDPKVQNILILGAHIAAQATDLALADAVAETCIEKVRLAQERQSVTEAVFRLVECTAANPDRIPGRLILAQRLETLAFILPAPETLADLEDLLETLKQVESEMAPLLGRAVAAARLGKHRSGTVRI